MAALTLSLGSNLGKLLDSRSPHACPASYSLTYYSHKYLPEVSATAPTVTETPSLPFDYPESITSKRVWSATDLQDESRFFLSLNGAEIGEIEHGLRSFEETHRGLDQVSRDSFPLPILAMKLKNLAYQLHNGVGCVILRGLDPSKYTSTQNLIIYLGVTSHIAEHRRRQDSDGNMLIHIKDYSRGGENRQPPFSNHAVAFHNDKSPIIAMYVLSNAAKGGESLIASSGHIYNIIASTRADLISVLAEPSWPFLMSADPSELTLRPLLFNFPDQGPAFCFSRRYFAHKETENAETDGVPALSTKQVEALALVEELAQKNACSINLQPGDIQLLNNFSVLHARTAFHDEASGARRHLVRLWLKNKDLAWKEPENLANDEWTTYGDTRDDGSEIDQRWPLVDESFTTERIQRKYEGCS